MSHLELNIDVYYFQILGALKYKNYAHGKIWIKRNDAMKIPCLKKLVLTPYPHM